MRILASRRFFLESSVALAAWPALRRRRKPIPRLERRDPATRWHEGVSGSEGDGPETRREFLETLLVEDWS